MGQVCNRAARSDAVRQLAHSPGNVVRRRRSSFSGARGEVMSAGSADALVFFGATGDLAYKKIFPALHGMARRGHLTMPVIAVAKSGWSLDQLRARAEESIERYGQR